MIVEPPERLVGILDPCRVGFRQNGSGVSALRIRHDQPVRVLEPVELLQQNLIGIARPVHLRDVVFPGIAGNLQPPRFPPCRLDDADAPCGIQFSGLGVRNRLHFGIQSVEIVDEIKFTHAGRIELPVGDAAAIGTPAKTVAQPQLFFVDPVERAVDQLVGTAGGQRNDLHVAQPLNVEIPVPHKGRVRSVGRESGEHQARFRCVAAEFFQRACGEVKNPVIAARPHPPHLAAVGEDQELRLIVGKSVRLDGERLIFPCRHELFRRNENLVHASGRIVPDQVAPGLLLPLLFQSRVSAAPFAPLHRGYVSRPELRRGKDPVERQQPGIVVGRGGAADSRQQANQDAGQNGAATNTAPPESMCLLLSIMKLARVNH
jgi:hypothetical protein